ncbi:hypothetical protein BDB01DRAFT_908871 [Pilobolus umbonatus]|nr:hypothetical protein BDB01DRAFT_908871 [Pilobolus umbonatus]
MPFPVEILEIIGTYLPKWALQQCSVVSRSWNITLTPILYHYVEIQSVDSLYSFHRTILHTLRMPDLGTLVKHITILLDGNKFTHSGVRASHDRILTNILKNLFYLCPNTESIVTHEPLVFQLLYTDYPILNNLKRIIDPSNKNTLYFDTLCKYRQTLTDVQLLVHHKVCMENGGIRRCLALFPCLTSLVIGIKNYLGHNHCLFLDILDVCPHLVHLEYRQGWSTDFAMDVTSYKPYSSLKQFSISWTDIQYNHIEYIKQTFVGLELLRLRIVRTCLSRNRLIEILNIFSHLNYILLDFYHLEACDAKRTVNSFWEWAYQCTHSYTSSVEIQDKPFISDKISLKFQVNVRSGSTHFFSKIYGSHPQFDEYCSLFGHSVNQLLVQDYLVLIDLMELNQVFPHLVKLELKNSFISINPSYTQPNLALLTIDSTEIDGLMLKMIETIYPNVTKLSIKATDLILNTKTTELLLPKRVESLVVILDGFVFGSAHLVAVNKSCKTWHIFSEGTQYFMKEYNHTTFIQHLKHPLVLLVSSHLKSVQIRL